MRCTGHCCRRFPLPHPLEEITRRRNADVCPPGELWIRDGEKLAEMLVPLGPGTYSNGEPCHYFTCKHHDAETGDCLDYANRPEMCVDFPYGKPCDVEGCTADNRGVPRETPLVPLRRGRQRHV